MDFVGGDTHSHPEGCKLSREIDVRGRKRIIRKLEGEEIKADAISVREGSLSLVPDVRQLTAVARQLGDGGLKAAGPRAVELRAGTDTTRRQRRDQGARVALLVRKAGVVALLFLVLFLGVRWQQVETLGGRGGRCVKAAGLDASDGT